MLITVPDMLESGYIIYSRRQESYLHEALGSIVL